MTLDLDQLPPLATEFIEECRKTNPEYHKTMMDCIAEDIMPDLLEPFAKMQNNLGPERFKALDMAYRLADAMNVIVLQNMTGGITKRRWGLAFWGWERRPEDDQ